MLFDLGRNIVQGIRLLSKGDGALLDVGAGDIDLQHSYCGLFSQLVHDLQVILHGFSADIDDDLRIPLHKYIDTGVLEADGVQHAAVYLRHTGCRVPGPGYIGYPLGHHCSQAVQIHKLTVFHTGAKGSGTGHHRIFQCNAGQIHFCIHQISTSFASKTGPSVQMRALCTWE